MSHEYVGILLGRMSAEAGAWDFLRGPNWYRQGLEEYLAAMLSSEHSRTVTMAKYRQLLADDPSRVGFFEVRNDYTDGAVMQQFLHEDFGNKKMAALLLSKEKTFASAMQKELGLTSDQLLARWSKWQKKSLKPTAKPAP